MMNNNKWMFAMIGRHVLKRNRPEDLIGSCKAPNSVRTILSLFYTMTAAAPTKTTGCGSTRRRGARLARVDAMKAWKMAIYVFLAFVQWETRKTVT